MAKNPQNREGVFLTPDMTAHSSIGAIGRVVVGDFDFRRKGSTPLKLLHSPLTPATDRENVGVSTAGLDRGETINPPLVKTAPYTSRKTGE